MSLNSSYLIFALVVSLSGMWSSSLAKLSAGFSKFTDLPILSNLSRDPLILEKFYGYSKVVAMIPDLFFFADLPRVEPSGMPLGS